MTVNNDEQREIQ